MNAPSPARANVSIGTDDLLPIDKVVVRAPEGEHTFEERYEQIIDRPDRWGLHGTRPGVHGPERVRRARDADRCRGTRHLYSSEWLRHRVVAARPCAGEVQGSARARYPRFHGSHWSASGGP